MPAVMMDSQAIHALCDALVSLETRDETARFLSDLCTPTEIEEMARRLSVAQLLAQGNTYQEIVKTTGASSATISRVNRSLHHGAQGYEHALGKSAEVSDA